MEEPCKYALIRLHIAVFLFGAAGLFGKLVTISALEIVLGRVGSAALALALFMLLRGLPFRISTRMDAGVFVMLGALLALHWWAFFMSIQISSVAIGVLTFTTFPVFILILEAVFFKAPIFRKHLISVFMCVVGLGIMMPGLSLSDVNSQGILWGVLAGFSFAVLSLINRAYAKSYHPISLTFYQCLCATIWCLLPIFAGVLSVSTVPSFYDISLLVFLGVVFTALAHGLFISSLGKAGLQTASITTMLEPVYGILLAWLLLGDMLDIRTAMGAFLILGAVALIHVPKLSAFLDGGVKLS